MGTPYIGTTLQRALVFGQYGEASTDVHELLDITVDRATRDSWRFLGARSQAEARSYFTSTLRRAGGWRRCASLPATE